MSGSLFSNTGGGAFATSRRGGIDEYERALIAEKAGKGVPLAAIAKMISRPVEEVKLVIGRPAERATYVPPAPARPTKGPGLNKIPPAVRRIVEGVAERCGLTADLLFSDNHSWSISHPRQECFALLRATQRYSYPLIGSWFGVHHTTVISGVKAFHKRRETPPADPTQEAMREYWRWQKQRAAEAA